MTIDRIDAGYLIQFGARKNRVKHRADTNWYWLILQFVYLIAVMMYGSNWKNYSIIKPALAAIFSVTDLLGVLGFMLW